jgi:hypothetical protein
MKSARDIFKLVEDLALRLSKPRATDKDSDAAFSAAAVAHGELRYLQGYTPATLVHESRILQVTIFGTLQINLESLDFSLVSPDVMTIADGVDAQLTQSMDSYMKVMRKSASNPTATVVPSRAFQRIRENWAIVFLQPVTEPFMKILLYAGLLVVVLGIASLIVPVPQTETHGIKAGDVNIGVQTKLVTVNGYHRSSAWC